MNILTYRKKAGLTQADVAEALKVDRSTVAYWENGVAMPRAELLPRIAALLSCTIDQLFEEAAG